MVGHLSRLDAIKLAIARGVARSGVKRALDHLQLEMAYGDDVIEELLVNGKFEELVHKYEGLSDLAAASGSAVESIADDASKHCFHARVDVSERDDGVCDPHDFGALRGLGGGRAKDEIHRRRMGVELRDDEHGRAVRALYVHGFMIRNRADLVKMIKITKDAVNRSTLENLLAHADAAGIGDDEARFLNYFGRTEDRRGAWARWLDHEAGTSGATRLCRLLREQRLAKYYVRSSRVLAHGDDNRETEQLEAVACQLAGVGGGHGLNQAHAGPWRYAAGDGRRDDTLYVFLAVLCASDWGDRPLREALDPIAAPWRREWSRGVEAAQRLANGSFAADAFGSPDDLLAATPRQILSALGKRRWAKVAALKARFSGLDLDGLTYATAMTPAGESYYAWLVAQARVKQRQQLGLDASPDVLRAAVVASHAAVLETTGYDDRASADARATSSGAAAFEALRQRDEDLVGRAGGYHAQCRALKARLDAAGFGVQDWSANATPKDTPFFLFMAARVREAARERLGQNVSALRAAFAEIRDIFREVADFEDDARAVSSDAAAFDALAAADAYVVNSARRKPKPKPAPKQKPAPAPKPPPALRFPQKLADIVARHADVVSWNATAGKLVIVDQARFERDVMPRYFNTSIFDSFRAQLRSYGFSSVSESEVDASLPAGVIVYSNTAVADLTKLVKRKSTSRPAPAPKPERPSRAERAVQRAAQSPAPAAAGPKKKAKTDCEARRVGEPWRYFVSQADAARAFPELTRADVSVLINNPSKVKVAVRGRFEARKVTERPAADEASSAPKRPRVHDDDDDNAAPGSGPAPELDGEVPPQNAPVAARAAAAAAAVAAVAAPPVLAPPAAAGASPKRARAASPVEEAVDGAEPPKRARCEAAAPPQSFTAAALAPDASAVVCKALLLAVDAGECWPRFVAAGVASVDVLLRLGEEQLVALGVQRDAVPRLRGALGVFQ